MTYRKKKDTRPGAELPIVPSRPDRYGNRYWSDRDKARCLSIIDFYGGNVTKAHRHLVECGWHIGYETLRMWKRKNIGLNEHVDELRAGAREELIHGMEDILEVANRRIMSLVPTASFRELIGTVSVLTEKVQLLKEMPTARVQHSGFLAHFNQQLNIQMPGGDGEYDSERELPEETEIVIQPPPRDRLPGGESEPPVDSKPPRKASRKGSRRK